MTMPIKKKTKKQQTGSPGKTKTGKQSNKKKGVVGTEMEDGFSVTLNQQKLEAAMQNNDDLLDLQIEHDRQVFLNQELDHQHDFQTHQEATTNQPE